MSSLAPSIIAADFSRLGAELQAVEGYASSWHVDVMDGHYVPNLTIGPMIVEAVARVSTLSQDVHLMITNPDDTWERYAKAGAARIAFHPDASRDPAALLRRISGAGFGAGVAVNPSVSPDEIMGLLDDADHLIVMSVNPGFSGQRFIPSSLEKLRVLRELTGGRRQLIIDGGVNLENAAACVEAGADVLVSASAIFGAADPPSVAAALRRMAKGTT